MSPKSGFKHDKYKNTRGGYSRWLLIACEKCKVPVCLYQKDGPGILKRLYLDRVIAPVKLCGLQKNALKKIEKLVCSHCSFLLGVPIIYEKENRLAWRLFAGAVEKKIVKANEMEDIKEDFEALESSKFIESIAKSRFSGKTLSLEEVQKIYRHK
ncbi:MAG: Uncharacterized protein G01um101418_762 [Parcubacteria group bacterium Gr01-1014_18]|nr:MAG: Uncharacterized protein Greene041636_768 [Parcubacteria group bacterium Greene0416_36]TSC80127.1 MAG: Uncharacterized protein G01um101418_762 [Parcubacteria group bacterium Gr01-1014_18]TSC99341.1 MAG: Uncharacterized protein Greene101420_269 [Parcubacteria group bacterium Greene1014_20]TSD06822.1 MAG: Uncharacterized protein Greene07142_556 [Parcubacteria group bacterium Greene0714_2]